MTQATAETSAEPDLFDQVGQNQSAEEQAPAVASDLQQPETTAAPDPPDSAGSGEVEKLTKQEPVNDFASDVAEYEAMEQQMASNPGAFDIEPTTPPVSAPAVSEPEPVPEPAPEPQAETPQPEGELTEPEPEAETQPSKEPQFRLRPEDELDAEAFRIFKAAGAADAHITMPQAIALASEKLGKANPLAGQPAKEGAPGSPEATAEEDPTAGITIDQVEDDLRELNASRREALREGDLDAIADREEDIENAQALLRTVQAREAESEQQSQQQFESSFQDSYEKAVGFYPDFGNEDSPLWKAAVEIDNALKTTNDPRYNDVNKPLIVAQLAAKQLEIVPQIAGSQNAPAPTSNGAKPQSASPQPARTEEVQRTAPLPAASGTARSSRGSTPAQSLEERISQVSSPDQYEELMERLMSGR